MCYKRSKSKTKNSENNKLLSLEAIKLTTHKSHILHQRLQLNSHGLREVW